MHFPSDSKNSTEIAIIGAGITGCVAALKCAKEFPDAKITLIEEENDIFLGTTTRNPQRMGIGVHYPDQKTQQELIRSAIEFIKAYQPNDYRVRALPYINQGCYFILRDNNDTKPKFEDLTAPSFAHNPISFSALPNMDAIYTQNNDFLPEEALLRCLNARDYYAELCKQDPSNQVLGKPEDYFKLFYIAKSDGLAIGAGQNPKVSDEVERYEKNKNNPELAALRNKFFGPNSNLINPNIVKYAAITTEGVFDVNRFKQDIKNAIDLQANINLLLGVRVRKLQECEDGPSLKLAVAPEPVDSTKLPPKFDYVVNCTWEDIARLSLTISHVPAHKVINRLKGIVKIRFNHVSELVRANCVFFCYGAHCSFTNLGDGTGWISYEPVTRIGIKQWFDELKDWSGYINKPLSTNDRVQRIFTAAPSKPIPKEFFKNLLNGVKAYIPAIEGVQIMEARFGIVQQFTDEVNIRNECGVEQLQTNLFNVRSMKWVQCVSNANLLIEQLKSNRDHLQELNGSWYSVQSSLSTGTDDNLDSLQASPDLIKAAIYYMKSYRPWISSLTSSLKSVGSELPTKPISRLSRSVQDIQKEMQTTATSKHRALQDYFKAHRRTLSGEQTTPLSSSSSSLRTSRSYSPPPSPKLPSK